MKTTNNKSSIKETASLVWFSFALIALFIEPKDSAPLWAFALLSGLKFVNFYFSGRNLKNFAS